jgi:uncharacterized protein YgiB involved in biofilm formation
MLCKKKISTLVRLRYEHKQQWCMEQKHQYQLVQCEYSYETSKLERRHPQQHPKSSSASNIPIVSKFLSSKIMDDGVC